MNALEVITWALGTIASVCVLAGLAVRYALIPYLREHIIQPVQQVKKQVTENSHKNAKPTLLDILADVRSDIAEVRGEVRVQGEQLEDHRSWAHSSIQQLEVDQARLGGEVEVLKRRS